MADFVMKLKSIILGIAVALVSVFFFVYAVQSVYPVVEFGDFCEEKHRLEINSLIKCEAVGGKWNDFAEVRLDVDGSRDMGYCDESFSCRGKYVLAKDVYERNVFFINLIIGTGILVVGFFLTLEAVSCGLMGSGVIMIVYGTIRYWGNLSDVWRTFVLGVSLAVLIWLGYRKLD